MSDKSKIEWTEATWNPVTGCDKVSPGCKQCYAETFAERFRGVKGHPYEQGFDLKLWPERLGIPTHWRKPRRIFVNSMSDLFHEKVPFDFVDAVFEAICSAPQHVYQILTKRPPRAKKYFDLMNRNAFILPNVWFGVSCEDQQRANERIPVLLQTPAAVRWVSLEPLLGPIDLSLALNLMHDGKEHVNWGQPVGLNWVVVGGESGPGARPMHPDWVRSLRDQCNVAKVPFFFKQWGAFRLLGDLYDEAGNDRIAEVSDDARFVLIDRNGGHWENEQAQPPLGTYGMFRCGKKKAGRLLDGREWNEYPGSHA